MTSSGARRTRSRSPTPPPQRSPSSTSGARADTRTPRMSTVAPTQDRTWPFGRHRKLGEPERGWSCDSSTHTPRSWAPVVTNARIRHLKSQRGGQDLHQDPPLPPLDDQQSPGGTLPRRRRWRFKLQTIRDSSQNHCGACRPDMQASPMLLCSRFQPEEMLLLDTWTVPLSHATRTGNPSLRPTRRR